MLLSSAQPLWTKSKWGPKDEIGAANMITPKSVLRAAKMIKTGKTYHLGMIIDNSTPSFGSRTVEFTLLQPGQVGQPGLTGLGSNRGNYNDDLLYAWLGTGSQIDGLGHFAIASTMYNGFNRSVISQVTGLTHLGIEKLPPLVARAVLLDMCKYYGYDIVPEGTAYTKMDVMTAAKQQGVRIQKGDIVLFYSGWMKLLDGKNADRKRFILGEPGIGVSGAKYLVRMGVLAIGADTAGVEAVPFENPDTFYPVHSLIITQNGILNLELMNTQKLIEDGVREFLFVLGPTRIRGASQMMINPIAIA